MKRNTRNPPVHFDIRQVILAVTGEIIGVNIKVPNAETIAGQISQTGLNMMANTALSSLLYRQEPNLENMAAEMIGTNVGQMIGSSASEWLEAHKPPKPPLTEQRNRAEIKFANQVEIPDINLPVNDPKFMQKATRELSDMGTDQRNTRLNRWQQPKNNAHNYLADQGSKWAKVVLGDVKPEAQTVHATSASQSSQKGILRSFVNALKEDAAGLGWAATHPKEVARALHANLDHNMARLTDPQAFMSEMQAQSESTKQAYAKAFNEIRHGNFDSFGRAAETLATNLFPAGKVFGLGKFAMFGSVGVKELENISRHDSIINNPKNRTEYLQKEYGHWNAEQRQARLQELAQGNRVLRAQGVPHEYVSDILQSFEPGHIALKFADNETFGLRFYGGISRAVSPYLNPTFSLGNVRELNALPPMNTAEKIMQWQVKAGSPYIFGRIRANFGMPGGGLQMYVPNFEENLLRPES